MSAHPTLREALERSGEGTKLKTYIQERLIQSGWRDDLKSFALEYIKTKGLDKITVDDIVAEIAPRGRATVPETLRIDLQQKVRSFARQQGLSG